MNHNFSSLSSSALGKTMRVSAFALVTLVLMACQAETNAQPVDATKYKPVREQMTVTTGDKIEVAELFWFGCGHCFALEPSLKEWKKTMPANAEFKKVPAIFSARWEFHGQAFYTMQALGVPEKAYDDFFKSIHVNRKPLNNMTQLVQFLSAFDKTEEQVKSAFNSFDINNKMRAAKKITRQSGAAGVPALVVDGKYITSQQLGGGTAQMFNIVNQLIDKAAAER
jgi:thiol:disulfide interchange protein DsbA